MMPTFIAPAPARPAPYTRDLHPGHFRAAHPLAPMPPRVPRARLQPHPPTLAWRSAAYYLDRLIRTEN